MQYIKADLATESFNQIIQALTDAQEHFYVGRWVPASQGQADMHSSFGNIQVLAIEVI